MDVSFRYLFEQEDPTKKGEGKGKKKAWRSPIPKAQEKRRRRRRLGWKDLEIS